MQAHSSTGKGRNANWALIPFLVEMQSVFERLRSDTSLQDAEYDPPFSDFNLVIDNHGAAVNVTVPRATARIKFRYSAKIDPRPVLDAVYAAAARAGIEVSEAREGAPPELPADHPLIRLCTDAVGRAASGSKCERLALPAPPCPARASPICNSRRISSLRCPSMLILPGDMARTSIRWPGECVGVPYRRTA